MQNQGEEPLTHENLADVEEDIFVFPLSFAQERLWFLYQLDPQESAYNLPVALKLRGSLQWNVLCQSLEKIVQRHEALRTTFETEDGHPVQVVHSFLALNAQFIDISALQEEKRAAEVQRIAREEAQRPFDLCNEPPLRVTCLYLAEDEAVLLFTMHHIVTDFWSMGILVYEVTKIYNAFITKQDAQLPDLPIQYGDFTIWQRNKLQGEQLEKLLTYWCEQFNPLPTELTLPTDKPRPPVRGYRGANCNIEISEHLTRALSALNEREGVTLFMTVFSTFAILLYRYTEQSDLVVGVPIANRNRREIESLIGFFVNTLALRIHITGQQTFHEVLIQVTEQALDAYAHQDMPFEKLVEELQPTRDLSRTPLFQVMFSLQNVPIGQLELSQVILTPLEIDYETALFDLSLYLEERGGRIKGRFEYNTELFEQPTIQRMVKHFIALLEGIVASPERRIGEFLLLTEAERSQLAKWNATTVEYDRALCLHQAIEEQVERTPDTIALVFRNQSITYRQLNESANRMAHYLQQCGIHQESIVGICVERSISMVIGLLGILKVGAAYLPLDPQYPLERLHFMLSDLQVQIVLTQRSLMALFTTTTQQLICLDRDWTSIVQQTETTPVSRVQADNLAYVICTSGSTGKPKAVQISHQNVMNFFAGMDQRIPSDPPGTWLAVTSISFDISLLELFWTLAHGFKVVIQEEQTALDTRVESRVNNEKSIEFSLFYFASDEEEALSGSQKYRLLLEGAQFADQHEFTALWTPERHFHSFGGLYPNPSVISAALAVLTKHVQIRAGSVVLPLQNPLRVAEEWALVDNLSDGRVGVSFASGWHANDFVLAPDNYAERRSILERDIATVQALWRGDPVMFRNGSNSEIAITIRPRPVQTELPVWLTAAGNPATFELAGKMGVHILTHLLGQSLEDLEKKIVWYRQAWLQHGHPGEGHVTLMLHTFVSEDKESVRHIVRTPFINYLRTSVDLLDQLAKSLGHELGAKDFSDDDREALLEYAFERYFETSGLFGTPQACLQMIQRLKAIGVDEVACLIDFGVDTETVLASLKHLDALRILSTHGQDQASYTVIEQITKHAISHMQCTPSLASILAADPQFPQAIQHIHYLLLGGEACPIPLATQLYQMFAGEIMNMYGPTETTIWSSTYTIPRNVQGSIVPIGYPIANTQMYILDQNLQPLPYGIPGDLYIGGDSVARGYFNRPELSAERFLPDPFAQQPGARMYYTGDRARYASDGNIEYLGRNDSQIKVHGFRLELGEIEAALLRHPAVRETVVQVQGSAENNDQQLIAYVVLKKPASLHDRELRRAMSQQLPLFMLPQQIVFLEQFPLMVNGKIDRQVLQKRLHEKVAEEEYIAPQTAVEVVVATVWKEVLGVSQVGLRQNFFALGGHSLLATTIVARLRAIFQVEIALRKLLEEPTIESQVQEICYLWNGDSKTVEEIAEAYQEFTQLSDAEARKRISL